MLSMGTSPEALVKKAGDLAAKEDIMGAADAYKEALSKDPAFVPAYDGLGKMYFRMGFRDEADREFIIADGLEKLENTLDDVEAGVKMGRALLDKGLIALAVTKLEPMLEKHPRRPELLKVMAICYKALEDADRARELFRTGLDLRPTDVDFYLQLSGLEIRAGNRKEGEDLTNTARLLAGCASDPNDEISRYNLGQRFFDRDLFDEAAVYLRQAVEIVPAYLDAWVLLGQTYRQLGLEPASVDALKQASRLAPDDPRPQRALAEVYHEMGRFSESRSAKEVASILEGGGTETKDPQKAARFLKYLLSIGKTEKCRTRLNRFLAQWPDSPELRLIHGRLLFKDNLYQEALDVLKGIAEEKENLAEPHIWMAMAYQRLGNTMSALAEGQLAIRLAPKSHVAHKIMGDIYREQKKFNMAENAYEVAENIREAKDKK